MKVIKHGNTIKAKVCEKCKCEFEYREIDIDKEPYEYMGQKFIRRTIKCPECGWKYIEK